MIPNVSQTDHFKRLLTHFLKQAEFIVVNFNCVINLFVRHKRPLPFPDQEGAFSSPKALHRDCVWSMATNKALAHTP